MSTLLTPRPPGVSDRFRVAARQESLFGGDAPREAPALAASPAREPARPEAAARTLDAAIASRWERLTAGELASCPVCDAPMETLRSAGSATVGGRCRSCGSTLT